MSMVKPIESSCTSCGYSLRANAKFCPVCGTKIEISKPVIKKKKAPKIRAKKEQIEDDSKHPSEVQLEAFTTIDAINFNLIPDILIRHHDELVKTGSLQSGKIGKSVSSSDHQLKNLCLQLLQNLINFKHANKTNNEYVLDLITKNKKIKQEHFDRLLEDTKSFLRNYKNKSKAIDSLISKNIGNKEILNKLKKRIDGGTFLSYEQIRYFTFCSMEIEKQKIFNSGIVPTGWLPDDIDGVIQTIRQDLEKSKSRQTGINAILGGAVIASAWYGWGSD